MTPADLPAYLLAQGWAEDPEAPGYWRREGNESLSVILPGSLSYFRWAPFLSVRVEGQRWQDVLAGLRAYGIVRERKETNEEPSR